jgi:hypothetical protein
MQTGSLFLDLESGGDVNRIDIVGWLIIILSIKDSSFVLYFTESNDLLYASFEPKEIIIKSGW